MRTCDMVEPVAVSDCVNRLRLVAAASVAGCYRTALLDLFAAVGVTFSLEDRVSLEDRDGVTEPPSTALRFEVSQASTPTNSSSETKARVRLSYFSPQPVVSGRPAGRPGVAVVSVAADGAPITSERIIDAAMNAFGAKAARVILVEGALADAPGLTEDALMADFILGGLAGSVVERAPVAVCARQLAAGELAGAAIVAHERDGAALEAVAAALWGAGGHCVTGRFGPTNTVFHPFEGAPGDTVSSPTPPAAEAIIRAGIFALREEKSMESAALIDSALTKAMTDRLHTSGAPSPSPYATRLADDAFCAAVKDRLPQPDSEGASERLTPTPRPSRPSLRLVHSR